ncbi:putative elongator complex protein 1 isoform X1 [Drosophila santomea]|uniref:putative elongator complex protein 1 isoform X1 n=1 Tax=Drosophila santomea TaxID=129105 RepID=UPI001954F08B|nr:putative elongator complex protein 1 isoform X1 [Drosophila santomea]
MRNLKLQYCNELDAVAHPRRLLLQPELNGGVSDTSFVVADNKVYAVHESGDVPPKVIADLPDIVGAEFLQLDNAICVASGAGEVILVDPQTGATSEGTFCDVGIESMAWSPNQEVVAFVTRTHNVVLMTSTFDVIAEQPLDAELAPDQQFVNVGWGKKETQFHGSEGKQAAKQTASDSTVSHDVQELKQDVSISWRGDGAFFVVSFVASQLGRTFKVYDSEGKLHHTAEKSANLKDAVVWRPTGNWIAVPQQFPNKSTIALFEKNGLRHRELVLPFDLHDEPVVQLRWSEDSDILAIRTAAKEEQRVYLYTIGNYHWYLKQVLIFEQTDPLALLHWDTRVGAEHALHILKESGKHLVYRWAFAVDRNDAVVGVIDGKRLLLTDFDEAIVPPPMSQRVLNPHSYINVFTSHNTTMCLYTSCGQIYLFENIRQLSEEHGRPKTLMPDAELSRLQLANLTIFTKNYLLATHSSAGSTRLLLLSYKDEVNEQGEPCYRVQSSLRINGLVNAVAVASHAMDKFYVQTVNNGHTYEVSLKADKTLKMERTYVQLAQPADQIDWVISDGYISDGYTGCLVTLRNQHLLHMDGHLIGEDVTSFCVVGNYLVYTQINAMHFVRLKDRRQVASRNIERGAKLVTAVDHKARVVLQLPRGNLEAICPRVLVLELVGGLLNAKKYQKAMQMARKQRINLNIIFDHDVEKFVVSVDDFLREIKESQWLCLFLSELQNEDITKGMYSSNYDAAKQIYPSDYRVDQKVEYVCRLLLRQMNEEDKRFRMPVITAYVKLGCLEPALQLIWKEKKVDATLADQLLQYLLYLVDVNDLYNVALGTYDFGLVLFVAQKSQKDPKEFLPYLNELKALPVDYRKFRIDDHLKKYASALSHLASCGEEHYDEASEFIRKHGLYTDGLAIYREHKEFQKTIYVAYADHLRASAKLDNASIMYERGGELQQALLSAKHTLDWQRVLVLAKKLGEPLAQVAQSLVGPLQQQGRHMEAYELVKEHCDDRKRQLEVLLEGHLYSRAIYMAGLEDENVLAEKIAPALLAYGTQLHSSLQADLELFLDYKQRLLDIRQRQEKYGVGNIDANVDLEEVDLLSDTTSLHSSRYSGTSRGTGKTFRSSKNRRKHQRKLFSLKPGNPFEDIALIDALHNHVTKIAQQQQPVRDTCKALLQLANAADADPLAAALQREFKTLLQVVNAALDEIWTPELLGNGLMAQHLTGPNVDYLALQKEQRYALISPLKRFKPQLIVMDEQLEILQ